MNPLEFFRRYSSKMRLTVAFFVAATSLHVPEIQTPQQQELQRLALMYNKNLPRFTAEQFERMIELLKNEKDSARFLTGAAFCAHSSGGAPANGGSSSTSFACAKNPRRKKDDASHLLAIDHLSYYM